MTPVKRSSKRRRSSSDTDNDDDSLIEELEIEATASSPSGRRRMLRRSTKTAPALSGDDSSEDGIRESGNGALGQLSRNEVRTSRRPDRNQKMDRKGTTSNDHDDDNHVVDSGIGDNRSEKRALSNSDGEVSDLEQDADYLRDTGDTDVTSYFE